MKPPEGVVIDTIGKSQVIYAPAHPGIDQYHGVVVEFKELDLRSLAKNSGRSDNFVTGYVVANPSAADQQDLLHIGLSDGTQVWVEPVKNQDKADIVRLTGDQLLDFNMQLGMRAGEDEAASSPTPRQGLNVQDTLIRMGAKQLPDEVLDAVRQQILRHRFRRDTQPGGPGGL